MRISTLSLEYVHIEVEDVLSATDPTADTVRFAFKAPGTAPVSGDFLAGDWLTEDGKYYARALVGTGGTHVLAAGTYDVWIKLTDNPEIPVRKVGRLILE